MKKLSFFFMAVMIAATAFAQSGKLNKSQTLTWLGIDYSQLRFIGDASQYGSAGEISNDNLRNKYFQAWNDLVIQEPNKYDVGKATGFGHIETATDVAEAINGKNTSANYFSDNSNDFGRLTANDISGMVKKYDYKGNKGTGLIFVVDGMDKIRKAASVWVVFVDMDNKSVLSTKHYVSSAGGFGFRNYWASAISKTMKDMKGDF